MDMKFLARRLVIEAAEEIGMADPRALQIAVANFEALDRVGLPEAMIPMMQTVIYLARAPKSNSVLQALHKASAIVDHSPAYQMPAHLRVVDESAGPQAGVMASKLQMNRHEHASDNARRQYLPDELVGTVFYEPSENDKL
jgi:putative ATPase